MGSAAPKMISETRAVTAAPAHIAPLSRRTPGRRTGLAGGTDPAGHAEILALRKAAKKRSHYRLTGCRLVVTLEPCAMCAGAAVTARVSEIIFGAADPKAGAVHSLYRIASDERLNHRAMVIPGVLGKESAALLTAFFRSRRKA